MVKWGIEGGVGKRGQERENEALLKLSQGETKFKGHKDIY